MHIRRSATVRGYSAVVWLMLLFLSPVANAQTPAEPLAAEPLIVEDTAGAVRIRHGDAWQPPVQGMTIELPAVVSTGDDGFVRLRQGETVISVAASTAIELYQGSAGRTLQRVVQSRGNAFYDIAPRMDNRLRVETPYLVAVIKGTEFNVSVSAESSTVALFEGRLRIEAPDIGDVVDLFEGQIARRHRDDTRITVIRMEDGEPIARNATPGRSGGTPEGDAAAGVEGDGGVVADLPGATPGDGGGADAGADPDIVIVGGTAGSGINAGSGLDGSNLDLAVDGGLNVDKTTLDLEAAGDIGLDETGVDAAVSAGAALGDAAGIDAELETEVDLGSGEADLGADVGADVGDASVDAGIDAGADLGSGDIELGTDLGADPGDAGVDVGLDAGGDLSGGELSADLGGGVDLGEDTLDVEVGADADLGSGEAEVDVGAAGVGLDLGLDTGGGLGDLLDAELDLDPLDDVDEDSGEDEPAEEPILDLGNLFGR